MAWKVNDKNEKQEGTKFDLMGHDWSVSHVRVLTVTCVSFNLDLPGLSLYGCKLCENKKGEKYITPNQTKVGEKYYKNYGLYLSDADTAKLIEEVESKIENA